MKSLNLLAERAEADRSTRGSRVDKNTMWERERGGKIKKEEVIGSVELH